MPSFNLRTTQRNRLLELIKELGLDPFRFQLQTLTNQESGKPHSVILKVEGESAFFRLYGQLNSAAIHAEIEPGLSVFTEFVQFDSWEKLEIYFVIWLDVLREEFEAPDLWAELARSAPIVETTGAQIPNVRFTPNELKQLSSGIATLQMKLTEEAKEDPQRIALIEERLAFLEAESTQIGKRTWFYALYTIISEIGISLALSPESQVAIGLAIHQVFSGILPFLSRKKRIEA